MATFSTYDAPVGVTGTVGGRRASAADFGADIGQAVQGAGAALGQLGEELRVREDKRSITQARASLSEFKTEFTRGELERQQAAPLGAAGHFEQSRSTYDEAFTEFSAGLTPIQQDAIAAEAQTARSTALRGSLSFQSQQAVKADINNIGVILKDIGNDVYSGNLTYEAAQEKYRSALADTVIAADGQAELMTAALPQLREQIANGLLENPVLGLTKLEDGELDFFPEAERDRLGDALVKRIDGMAQQAELDRMAGFATANPEVFGKVMDNQMSLRELSSLKDTITPDVYNALQARIIAGTIRKRSPEEVQDVTLELTSAFVELEIKRKKGKSTSSEDLEDVLRFQNLVMRRVSEGSGIDGVANRMLRATAEVAVRKAKGEHGTTVVGRFFGSDDPFELAIDAIETYGETAAVTDGDKVGLLLGFVNVLDAAEQSGTPIEGQEAVRGVVNKLIEERFRADNPDLALAEELPQAVIRSDGTVSRGVPAGAPTTITSPDVTVPGGARLERDSSGNEAYVVRDNSGRAISVTEVGRAETIQRPVPEVSQAGTKIEVNPTTGVTERVTRNKQGVAVTVEPVDAKEVRLDTPPSQARVISETDAVVGDVISRLPMFEGVEGDDLTEVETMRGGLTRARWDELNADAGYALTAADAQAAAVRQDFAVLNKDLPGFRNLRQPMQAALLDLAYNIGTGNITNPARFMGLREAVAEGNETLILMNTLRTATVDNETVKGLAVRRATMHNQANRDPRLNITEVEMLADGTVNYLSGSNVVYTFKRPRHAKSAPGRTAITGAG